MTSSNERAADRAYRMIRADIMSGELEGGARLGEANLAERYGLSRTPVRESLRRLQSEGLVEVLPHRGARVVDWRSLDIAAIYDMRAVVEGFMVRRAAVTMSDEEIDRLTTLCDKVERQTAAMELGDPELIDLLAGFNREFHGSIARAAGGEIFAAVRASVVIGPLMLRTVHDYTRADQERSNRHHREILAAFRARSPQWAESVMLAHVYSAKSRLLEGRGEVIGPDAASIEAS
ncbi:transcriptional regulator, GntR family [Pseudonocardia dioxanivorans CB1190]|uniref:Transcriptional regulator, GntR family n=1 Tax=Pseudonocardia dioxanivorans (strain ATCC 55486 / DSM 44775 / JCM 13855 / CB1190) TaxID=675635 RepID=F4CT96_PSEUX|nr:GntR family transcriptional regulator [Pseudonocardia dioxanivorans]AEA26314.1 transcriptional regulator, GntR family [Pseudonocardia dioxanivorans CB1190]